jgi:hypothetical protein
MTEGQLPSTWPVVLDDRGRAARFLIGVGVVKAKVGRKERRLSLRTDFKKRIDRKARHIELDEADIRHLTAFLRTLTGRPIDPRLRTDPWAASPAAPTGAPTP